MMKTMIPPQVGMRLRTLKRKEKKEERPKKEKGQKKEERKKEKNNKMREKERRDNALIMEIITLLFTYNSRLQLDT